MSRTELEAEALKLPLADRARLVEALLESLDALSDDEARELWVAEAARRDALMDEGEAGVPAADVLEGLRERVANS